MYSYAYLLSQMLRTVTTGIHALTLVQGRFTPISFLGPLPTWTLKSTVVRVVNGEGLTAQAVPPNSTSSAHGHKRVNISASGRSTDSICDLRPVFSGSSILWHVTCNTRIFENINVVSICISQLNC